MYSFRTDVGFGQSHGLCGEMINYMQDRIDGRFVNKQTFRTYLNQYMDHFENFALDPNIQRFISIGKNNVILYYLTARETEEHFNFYENVIKQGMFVETVHNCIKSVDILFDAADKYYFDTYSAANPIESTLANDAKIFFNTLRKAFERVLIEYANGLKNKEYIEALWDWI